MTQLAGMSAGRYSSPVGSDFDVSDGGRVSVPGTPCLAGSGASLRDIVCLLSGFVGLPFLDGLSMATRNPARLLGHSVGLLPGTWANFILFGVNDKTGLAAARDVVFDGENMLQ